MNCVDCDDQGCRTCGVSGPILTEDQIYQRRIERQRAAEDRRLGRCLSCHEPQGRSGRCINPGCGAFARG